MVPCRRGGKKNYKCDDVAVTVRRAERGMDVAKLKGLGGGFGKRLALPQKKGTELRTEISLRRRQQ